MSCSQLDPVPDPADLSAALVAQQEIEMNAVLIGMNHIGPAIRALFAVQRAAQAGRMPCRP